MVNSTLGPVHPALKKDFPKYCRTIKAMRPLEEAPQTHTQLVLRAIEFLDEKERDPMVHFTEEFNEVVEAVCGDDPMNAIEEIGDLLFTAIRLARSKGHDVNVSDVIWANHHKLSLRKEEKSSAPSVACVALTLLNV